MFRIVSLILHTPSIGEKCAIPESSLEGMDLSERLPFDISKSRYASVTKGLRTEVPYFFYKGYEFHDRKLVYLNSPLGENFFNEEGKTPIDVCAIVGENGSGKSTIFELIIRMMNNIAYVLRNGFTPDGQYDDADDYALHFIPDIYASLYFHTDDGIYEINQNGVDVSFYLQDSANLTETDFSCRFVDIATPSNIDNEKARTRLAKLFYSVIINYAAYAYNTNDYMSEWDDISERGVDPDDYTESLLCWFTSLFHKNDGYQVPIVINPYRDCGIINYNNENTLLRDRIFELIEAFRGERMQTLTDILQGKSVHSFFIDEHGEYNPMAKTCFACRRVVNIMQRAQLIPYDWKGKKDVMKKIEEIGNRIVDAWGAALGNLDLRKSSDRQSDMDDTTRALNYLVYKTIKITLVYDSFFKYRYCWHTDYEVSVLVDSLKTVDNHITRKLRQALAFLIYHHYNTKPLDEFNHESNEIKIDDFVDRVENLNGQKTDVIVWSMSDLMPAPCFNTDIRFRMPDEKMLAMSSFSSGEKQMLHLICTVIYHLINLHTVVKTTPAGKVGYPYINLMIDEIELYFHPRYQTKLLNFILDAIQLLDLEGIKGVNIMIATHSPYLLSDIPSSNILKLEHGVPNAESDNENFGANVYEILHDKFFMSQFMGDFAKKKISEIISEVVDAEDGDKEYLSEKIELIGDSLIRNTLKEQFEGND